MLQTDDLTQVKDDESHSTIVLFITPKSGQIYSKILEVNIPKSYAKPRCKDFNTDEAKLKLKAFRS